MAGDTIMTVVGNLTADPELRYTASGAPVADFTVAATPRTFDRAAGEWKDGDPLFLRCSLWRQPAENASTSLTKGARVIVEGVLRQRSFETKDGDKRTVVELDVDEIGASLRYATVKINRASPDGNRRDGGDRGRGDDHTVAVDRPRQATASARPVAVAAAAAGDDDF
jgi:single-strand DNA-binding protein